MKVKEAFRMTFKYVFLILIDFIDTKKLLPICKLFALYWLVLIRVVKHKFVFFNC